MQIIHTLPELDEKLKEIGRAATDGDDAMRNVFRSFRMELGGVLPLDPFGDEYHRFQMELYQVVSGRSYSTENEVSVFDVEAHVARPFPFATGSVATTGAHLSSLGFLISQLHLPQGARILEFGPGWGNTTITLALLGFEVTAVDVEANFCHLIQRRADLNRVKIQTIVADFFHCERVDEKFDAIVFYECFHHCADHLRLLRGLHHALKPNGRIYLGAEPITSSFPIPWGLRLDGESLWAVRQNGWMELGFNEDYFRDALIQTGWQGHRQASKDVDWAVVWELSRPVFEPLTFDADDERLKTVIGRRAGASIVVSNREAGFALYGPYTELAAGKWHATIRLQPGTLRSGTGFIDAGCFLVGQVFATHPVDLDRPEAADENDISILFTLRMPVNELEVRIYCQQDAELTIAGLDIRPA